MQVGAPPLIVLRGEQKAIEGPILSAEDADHLLRSIATSRQMREMWERGEMEFLYNFRNSSRLSWCMSGWRTRRLRSGRMRETRANFFCQFVVVCVRIGLQIFSSGNTLRERRVAILCSDNFRGKRGVGIGAICWSCNGDFDLFCDWRRVVCQRAILCRRIS